MAVGYYSVTMKGMFCFNKNCVEHVQTFRDRNKPRFVPHTIQYSYYSKQVKFFVLVGFLAVKVVKENYRFLSI